MDEPTAGAGAPLGYTEDQYLVPGGFYSSIRLLAKKPETKEEEERHKGDGGDPRREKFPEKLRHAPGIAAENGTR
ncbi:unnamed protein product [Lota lota]